MAMRQARAHNHCPRCHHSFEDTDHVLHCQEDDDAIRTWTTAMDKIKDWCLKVNTVPSVVSTLFPLLIGWQSNKYSNKYSSRDWDPAIRKNFLSQARLGWDSLLAGILSTEWATLQEQYYQSLGSRKQGQKWSSDFSRRLWEAVYSMWEHRNLVMHRTGKITEFSGGKELQAACLAELALGFQNLEEIYHPYIDMYLAQISLKSQRTINVIGFR